MHYYAESLGHGRAILRCDVVIDGELEDSHTVGSPAPVDTVRKQERTTPLGTFRPRRHYTCAVCGGAAHRRFNASVRIGYEDAAQPLLHLNQEDWGDNPHEVVPVRPEGEVRQ
jgi:hypothetical protein